MALQFAEHHAFERCIVLGKNKVTETLAYLGLDRGEFLFDFVHVGAAHRQFGFKLRIVGAEAQLDAAVGSERFDAVEQAVGVRFADTVRMKTLEINRRLFARFRQQARNDLVFEHAPQFTRHARGEHETRLADGDGKAAGGAHRVVDDLGGRGQHCLFDVVRRHDAAAAAEVFLHRRQPLFTELEFNTGGFGGDFLREVINRRSEAAVDDHRIGPLAGELKRQQQVFAIVADRGLPFDGEPAVFEFLRDVAEVGIDDFASENFVTGADDFDAHAGVLLVFRSASNRSINACKMDGGRRPRPIAWR